MATVTIRYWAGARQAAGTAEESVEAATVADALQRVRASRRDPHFERVLGASSILLDGGQASTADLEEHLEAGVTVEILPPFAGGSRTLGRGAATPARWSNSQRPPGLMLRVLSHTGRWSQSARRLVGGR